MAAAVAYLESLGHSLADGQGSIEPASRREAIVRAMASIRDYEALLSEAMLTEFDTAGAIVYGVDDPARVTERVPTFCFRVPGVAPAQVSETMSGRGIAIRDGHMYAPRLMKHLGLALDTGVNRASILHYNTLEEIHEFGKVLRDIVPGR